MAKKESKPLGQIIITINDMPENKIRSIDIKITGKMSQFEVLGALEFSKNRIISIKTDQIKTLEKEYIG